MATGFAHIIKLGTTKGTDGTARPQYQFCYSDGESSYARTLAEDVLGDFLQNDLGVEADVVDRALNDLRSEGNAIIADLHITENQAAALGLVQAASEV